MQDYYDVKSLGFMHGIYMYVARYDDAICLHISKNGKSQLGDSHPKKGEKSQ